MKTIYTVLLLFSVCAASPSKNNVTQILVPNNRDTIVISLDTSLVKFTNQKSDSNWFELSIPFFVAIIGGLIAIYQVRINIIKSARINWIENLRDNISHFISATESVRHNLDLMISDINSETDPDKAFSNHSKELISAFSESIMYTTKVNLYLNLKENLHKQLNEKIKNFIEVSNNTFDNRDKKKAKAEILIITNDITMLSQKILKKEWDRVSKTWFKKLYQALSKTD